MTSRNDIQPSTIIPSNDPAARAIIDTDDGIDRIMGDRALYARMLERFRKDYQYGTEPIGRALAHGDPTLAHRLAHTLKGASGMIGARTLHQHACNLERALLAHTDAQQELNELAEEFSKVLGLLDTMLVDTQVSVPKPAGVTRVLLADAALLAKLVELLKNADGAAIDLLEESSASLSVILGDAVMKQVVAAANAFDFDAALDILQHVSK